MAWPWQYFLSIIIMSSDAKDGQHHRTINSMDSTLTSSQPTRPLFLHDEEMVDVDAFLATQDNHNQYYDTCMKLSNMSVTALRYNQQQ